MENIRAPKKLLDHKDRGLEYGLGRDLNTRLARLLPHVKAGRAGTGEKLLVHRSDMERLIERAKAEGADLWELTRRHTPESFRRWLTGDTSEAA